MRTCSATQDAEAGTWKSKWPFSIFLLPGQAFGECFALLGLGFAGAESHLPPGNPNISPLLPGAIPLVCLVHLQVSLGPAHCPRLAAELSQWVEDVGGGICFHPGPSVPAERPAAPPGAVCREELPPSPCRSWLGLRGPHSLEPACWGCRAPPLGGPQGPHPSLISEAGPAPPPPGGPLSLRYLMHLLGLDSSEKSHILSEMPQKSRQWTSSMSG